MEGPPLPLLIFAVWLSGSLAEMLPRGPGETLAVQCEYPMQFKNYVKVWCRETSRNFCNDIVSTGTRSSERTRVEDNKQTQIISVTVQMLAYEDTGAYWCGLDSSNGIHILKRIELRVSDGVPALVILRGPGETVIVYYDYPSEYQSLGKTWCRERSTRPCDPIVTTTKGVFVLWTSVWWRTHIRDVTQTQVVSVTIENLITEDTGVYWIRMDSSGSPIFSKSIALQVSEGVRAQVISHGPGENVTMQCAYLPAHAEFLKIWCRETIRNTCNPVVTTQATTMTASSGRTTIWNDQQKRVISVRIQALTVEDAGVYWCGVQQDNNVHIMKRFELQVSNDAKGTTGNTPTTVWNQTPTTVKNQTPTLDIETHSGQDVNDGLLDRHIIYIGVGLGLLLLITLIALFYVVWIRRRRRAMQRMKDDSDTNGENLSAGPAVPTSRARAEAESRFPEMDSHEVKYASLTHHGADRGDPTYSNVGFARRLAAPVTMTNPEDVEYASLNL